MRGINTGADNTTKAAHGTTSAEMVLTSSNARLQSAQTTSLPRALMLAVAAYAPIWGLVLGYAALVQAWVGLSDGIGKSLTQVVMNLVLFLAAILPVLIAWRLAVYARRGVPESTLRQLLLDARQYLGNPARLTNLIVLFPSMYLFLQAFSVFKGNIAYAHPFSWDVTFMELDKWLHGGRHPWEWLQPLLEHPLATFGINFIYNLWFFLAIGSLLWAVGMRRANPLATRYLLAYLLTWIIAGSFMALAFSSAGPAFYARLGLSPDPYAPLMDILRQAAEHFPIWALTTQDMLWQHYLEQNIALAGISAFPSMHNAQATLLALLVWRAGGLWRAAGIAFAAAIAIGSVWLAWHYAVDAYAGIAMALLCWWLAGILNRWLIRRPAMQALRRILRKMDDEARRPL